jgi:hypothetical protein
MNTNVAFTALEIVEEGVSHLFWEVAEIGARTDLVAPFVLDYSGRSIHPISQGDRMKHLPISQ